MRSERPSFQLRLLIKVVPPDGVHFALTPRSARVVHCKGSLKLTRPLLPKQAPRTMIKREPANRLRHRFSASRPRIHISQILRVAMNHETAVSNAKEMADRVLAPAARQNDKEGRFPSEAVGRLGRAGLLGMMLPAEFGGAALGPRTFAAVTATLAEADASVAMVYLMHVCAAATISAARPGAVVGQALKEIAAGRLLSTLAFSEAGSRSHFWTPVSRARRNGAGVRIAAKKSWVTSAGHAHSYVVSSLAPQGAGPTDSTLYLVPAR